MIRDPETGLLWGTKEEIAEELCLHPRTGPELVRSWGRRDRIRSRLKAGAGRGVRYYPLVDAEAEERRSSEAGTGRPRA